ncbi:MAG: ATP-binding protein [Vulcanimicrobiota bacterium]
MRLPTLGFFSTSFALCLAQAAWPGAGPTQAAMGYSLALITRSLIRSGPHKMAGLLIDLTPILLSLNYLAHLGSSWQSLVTTCLLWLVLSHWIPQILAGRLGLPPRARQNLLERAGAPHLAAAFMALMLGQVAWTHPWCVFCSLPVLASLQRSANAQGLRLDNQEKDWLRAQEAASKDSALAASQNLQKHRAALELQQTAQNLMREAAWLWAQARTQSEILVACERLLAKIGGFQSLVLFQPDFEGCLVACEFSSPYREALKSQPLTRLQDPQVEEAWRGSVASIRIDGFSPLFESEKVAAAFPIGRRGVIYFGRGTDQAITPEQRYLLTLLSDQMPMALQIVEAFELQEKALREQSLAVQALKPWAERQAYLLQASQWLNSSLSRQNISEALFLILSNAFPQGRLWLGEQSECASCPSGLPDNFWRSPPAHSLLLANTAGQLLVATLQEYPVRLVILLENEFSRAQVDFFSAVCNSARGATSNAALHESVLESQARLIQASKLAAIGQMAAGLAHELNTPLGAASLMLETAMDSVELQERVRNKLLKAGKSLEQCQNILNKLLFYSREGTQLGQVDLEVVVRETLDLYGAPLGLDRLQMRVHTFPVQLTAVASDLQQVLVNLLSNAADAVGAKFEGAERIIGVGLLPSGDGFFVEDSGPGVPGEIVSRVIEPFFTSKPPGQGTGLGLWVCQQIAEKHGGRLIHRRSALGGARFEFCLGPAENS